MDSIISWSPSRLAKYDECPRKAKYEIIDKLCPVCFEGKVMGGFETPAICDTCGATIKKGDALERGTDIGNRLDEFLGGTRPKPPPEIRNPKVTSIVKAAKLLVSKAKAQFQLDIILDRSWKLLKKTGDYAPRGYWAWFKLDFYELIDAKAGLVTDWKTGGIDKRTGEVRAEAKYDDQLDCYQTAALCAFPLLDEVDARLVFLDTGPRFEPVVKRLLDDRKPRPPMKRTALPKAQAYWEKRVKAMLSDHVFAPRPNEKCKYCDFSVRKGGPCPN